MSRPLHELIKNARQAKGWSMEQLAEAVSLEEGLAKPLNWQTIQQWERPDGTAPKRKRMVIVARVLDFSTPEIFEVYGIGTAAAAQKEEAKPPTSISGGRLSLDLTAALQLLAYAAKSVDATARARALDLIKLVVTDPEGHAEGGIPMIVKHLSGESAEQPLQHKLSGGAA